MWLISFSCGADLGGTRSPHSSHEKLYWLCKRVVVAAQYVLPGIPPMYSEADQLLAHVGWGVHDSILSMDVQGMELC